MSSAETPDTLLWRYTPEWCALLSIIMGGSVGWMLYQQESWLLVPLVAICSTAFGFAAVARYEVGYGD